MPGLRIATFNLENLDERPSAGIALSQRLAILRPQLMRLRADVLCLQEVNAQKPTGGGPRRFQALDRLLEDTPYATFQRAASGHGLDRSPRDVHNLVVLSRFPIATSEQLHNNLVPTLAVPKIAGITEAEALEPLAWDRPLLHVTLALEGGRRLHVINLHLRAPSGSYLPGEKLGPFAWKTIPGWATASFLSAAKRNGQALEARLLLDRILSEEPEAWIAVCGDFNAEACEVPLRLLIAADEDTGNGALAAGTLIALERSLPADRRFSVLHHGRPQMLDHILVSRGLSGAYRAIEVHNEALGDELVAYRGIDSPPESYHAPLVADFDCAADA